MYEYRVHKDNSPKKFKEACRKIEENYPNAVKQKLLIDVDGTTIQTYTENNKDINVFDNYDVGAVYIDSDVDLGELFEQFNCKSCVLCGTAVMLKELYQKII